MAADLDTYAPFENLSEVTGTTLILTCPEDLPAGTVIVLATNRSTGSGTTNGVTSITGIGGASWTLNHGSAGRASTFDLGIHSIELVSPVTAGATFTITWTNNQSRRVAEAKPVGGLTGAIEVTTGNNAAGQDGGSSYNYNGASGASGSIPGSSIGNPVETSSVAFSAFATGAAGATSGSGWTEIGQIATAAGSSDRGVILQYKILSAAGDFGAADVTYSPNSAWAGVVITMPVEASGVEHTVNISDTASANDEPTEQTLSVTEILSETVDVTDTVVLLHVVTHLVNLTENISATDSVATFTSEEIPVPPVVKSVSDRIMEYLTDLGYTTGSISDRQRAFLLDLNELADDVAKSSADLQRLLEKVTREVLIPEEYEN